MKTSKSKPVGSGPSPATQRQKGASCAATAGSAISQIKSRYTSITKGDGKYMPWLKIDHQSFPVTVEYTDRKTAEWYRRQLAIALHRMLSQSAKLSCPERGLSVC
jgi:hypothetical protein